MQISRFILPLSLGLVMVAPGITALAHDGAGQAPQAGQQIACHKDKDGKGGHKNMTDAEREARHAEMKARFAQELGLTQEQQSKIDAIHQAFKESHKAQFDAMKARHEELRRMKENGASKEELQAYRESMKQEFQGLKAEREKLVAQINQVLTPEQAAKFETMRAEHKKKWEQKRARHHKKDAEAGEMQPPAESAN